MSDKGRIWASEALAGRDERTGNRVWQMTQHPSINHSLYFLTSSFLPDDRSLIFAGFRNGRANLFRAAFPDGDIVQLTDVDGICSFSAVISAAGSHLWFTRGASIIALALTDLSERVVADFPGGRLGEVSLSADERWVVSAVTLADGFGVAVASADGSDARIIHRRPEVVIHPQFHPRRPELIEYAVDPAPRIHVIHRDGTANRCLYEHGIEEWVVHETWLPGGDDLVFTSWPRGIKRLRLPACEIETVAEFNAWHISPSPDGRFIICDTNCPDAGIQLVEIATGRHKTLCHPGSSNGGSQWAKGRVALKADFEEAARAAGTSVGEQLSWTDMRTDTVYGPQWTHPHPAFSRTGRFATFTSDRTGHPQVYVVETGLGTA